MNKAIASICIIVMFTCCSVVAQKDATVSPELLKDLIGCWQGTLNYNGTIIRKSFTTTAKLVVKQTGTSNTFELLHIYPQAANEQRADTLSISEDGKKLNKASIISKRRTPDGNLEIITEMSGFDHDNNKAAIIRQTYTIGKELYTYKQQVQLENETEWLDRREFIYLHTPCRDKD